MPEKSEKPNINELIINFIQKNRKALLFTLGSIIVIIIGFIIFFSIQERLVLQAFIRIDELNTRYEDLVSSVGFDEEHEQLVISNELRNSMHILLDDLAGFTGSNKGFSAARAFALSANLHEIMSNWQEAEIAWTEAARAAPRTYFAPIAYFNAAVAAEEQGNNSRAIELFNMAVDYGSDFPAAPRAQFSIGRILESQGDRLAAIAAYQSLVNNWPEDQIWANLAQSRILALSMGLF